MAASRESGVNEVRVVVVDDVAEIAESLAATLQVNGYSVRIAADGEQALAVIGTFQPHCCRNRIGGCWPTTST